MIFLGSTFLPSASSGAEDDLARCSRSRFSKWWTRTLARARAPLERCAPRSSPRGAQRRECTRRRRAKIALNVKPRDLSLSLSLSLFLSLSLSLSLSRGSFRQTRLARHQRENSALAILPLRSISPMSLGLLVARYSTQGLLSTGDWGWTSRALPIRTCTSHNSLVTSTET